MRNLEYMIPYVGIEICLLQLDCTSCFREKNKIFDLRLTNYKFISEENLVIGCEDFTT